MVATQDTPAGTVLLFSPRRAEGAEVPRERLSMRKIKEVLRLKQGCGLSNRVIAHSCGIARSTVAEYMRL